MVAADQFLGRVRDYQAASGSDPYAVVLNPTDQDEIEADVAAGAPSPQVPLLVRRDVSVPVGQPRVEVD